MASVVLKVSVTQPIFDYVKAKADQVGYSPSRAIAAILEDQFLKDAARAPVGRPSKPKDDTTVVADPFDPATSDKYRDLPEPVRIANLNLDRCVAKIRALQKENGLKTLKAKLDFYKSNPEMNRLYHESADLRDAVVEAEREAKLRCRHGTLLTESCAFCEDPNEVG